MEGILHPPAPADRLHMDGGPTLPAGLGAISVAAGLGAGTSGAGRDATLNWLTAPWVYHPVVKRTCSSRATIRALPSRASSSFLTSRSCHPRYEMTHPTPNGQLWRRLSIQDALFHARLLINDSLPTCRRPIGAPASQPPTA
ncbi:hypothetical protein HPB52_010807 [Rhipicephalus sanguineus]|uniref:Uncharacterized protein n=1 Tax=Rhipicephalus sanguineus TaxID=34632 RepID=A0A9D4Q6B0_RHISA|nr:hypothetical protein HPB52_010807 [Rhipicephalus sanguineus]